jgi:Protein of unknown function (DUF2637)
MGVATKVNADKLTRVIAVAAAVAVTAVAAMISYRHAVEVVTRHGASGLAGHLYPVVIDGPLVVASMVVVDSARRHVPAGALAWATLAAGIVATITVNLLSGIEYGIIGAIIAAWPAAAFVGTYELLMVLIRRSASHRTDPDQDDTAPATSAGTATEAEPAQAPPVLPAEIVAQARALDAEHRAVNRGKPISRDNLRLRLSVATDTATALTHMIRAEHGTPTTTEQDDQPPTGVLPHAS